MNSTSFSNKSMPTANDPLDPARVLDRILTLQAEIARIVGSEQEWIKSRNAANSSTTREIQRAEEADAERIQQKTHDLAREYQIRMDRLDARFNQRRSRIQDAYHSSRNSLSQRVQEEKDRRVGQVHGEILRARHARAAELDRTTAVHQEFQQVLAADRVERIALRDSALKSLRSFRPILGSAFLKPTSTAGEGTSSAHDELHTASRAQLAEASKTVASIHSQPLSKLFRFLPLLVLLGVAAGVYCWLAFRPGGGGSDQLIPGLGLTAGAILAIWSLALALAFSTARKAAAQLADARALAIAAEKSSAAGVATLAAAIQRDEESQNSTLTETFRESDEARQLRMSEGRRKLEQQHQRLPGKLDALHQRELSRLARYHEQALTTLHAEAEALANTRQQRREGGFAAAREVLTTSISGILPEWKSGPVAALDELTELNRQSLARFPAWDEAACAEWAPPAESPPAIRIGQLEILPRTLAGSLPEDPRLALPEFTLAVPLALGFPLHGSLLIESDGHDGTAVLAAISLRLLASFPPGRSSFVFIDPVGLGREFAGLMHLADYEEMLIHHRIWTQTTHIEERLAELNEHIEKVIQMYLRNEFATLADYNAQAGTIAEKHRFLVIAGFPASFSDTACKRLLSIVSSGARCGVHVLIQHDLRQPPADAALLDELRRQCLRITHRDGNFTLTNAPVGANSVRFDSPPSAEDTTTLVHRIGRSAIDSNRVEVPFAHIAPGPDEMWSLHTADELRFPIGRTGAKKLQYLALGKGTRQHALVAGKTGSGKSTLFHVIISNLALWCSPDEVEFYLVDFKKGVEFKCYAAHRLPHARVIAIESDRGFALSVLQRIDGELRRRGDLFRKAGCQDLPGYLKTPGATAMPRSLLLIDEFQEFFTEDDPIAQEASLLLDRIVRQGRAFGIHVILGSQTLGGAYTLARATLGQMVVRIALQCNEADAALIMEDDNPAPRLLNRPGEGIYNDQAGAIAANSPFQIVWLPEAERDARLDAVQQRAADSNKGIPVPVIFEGNAPAEILENSELAALLKSPPTSRPAIPRAWLGAPNSIKGPTEAAFPRQNGSHLLLLGQATERNLTLLGISFASLAAQYPVGKVEFYILDPTPAPSFFQTIAEAFPHPIRIAGPGHSTELLATLAAHLDADSENFDAPERFLIIHDLQRFKSLKPDDEFRFSLDDDALPSASASLTKLLNEGGPAGIHVLAGVDTWNNLARWIPRKLLAEFELRVLFQMSAGDSSNLIDSPAAASLGLHRALLHNEHLGTQETFRPYAMPTAPWPKDV
jgi:hypothetical protein